MCENFNNYPKTPLRVAVAQAQPIAGDITGNVSQAVDLIKCAAERGARVILFPEKFLNGYEPDLIKSDPTRYAVSDGDVRLVPISRVCQELCITAIVGAATIEQSQVFITSLCFDESGQQFSQYHKRALFSSEADIFLPGQNYCSIQINGWILGLAICYDSGFAEHARTAALNGCHAYLVSALFSQGNGYHESRIWMPARALDNTMYVMMANHVGETGGWKACGCSGIWGPYGNLLLEASTEKNEVIVVDLEPEVLKDVRKRETMLKDFSEQYYVLASTSFEEPSND